MVRNTSAFSLFQILLILALSTAAQSQNISFFIISSTPAPSPSLSKIFYTSLAIAINIAESWQDVNITNPFTIYVGNGGNYMDPNLSATIFPSIQITNSSKIFKIIILPFFCNQTNEELKSYMSYCSKDRPVVDFPHIYGINYFFNDSLLKMKRINLFTQYT